MPTSGDNVEVNTRFVVDHNVPGLAAVDRKIAGIGASVQALGRNFGMALGFVGAREAIRGLAAVGSQLIGIHTQSENAKLGIAGLYAAMNKSSVADQLGLAGDTLKQLRADAAAGAGGLQDYADAYQMLLAPVRAAGGDLEKVRELTKLGIAGGFAMRGPEGMKLGTLDILQGLQGGLSAAESQILMPLLTMAGSSLDELNKADKPKKLEIITKALKLMEPAAEAMGKTWSAQMSTLGDHAKSLARTVTAPLFERWSQQLRTVNTWLGENAENMRLMANVYGQRILNTYDQLIERSGQLAKTGLAGGAFSMVARSGAVGAAGAAVGGAGAGGLAATAGILTLIAAAGFAVHQAFANHPELWAQVTAAGHFVAAASASLGNSWRAWQGVFAAGSPVMTFMDLWGRWLITLGTGLATVVGYTIQFGDALVRLGAYFVRIQTELLPMALGKHIAFMRKDISRSDRDSSIKDLGGKIWDETWNAAAPPAAPDPTKLLGRRWAGGEKGRRLKNDPLAVTNNTTNIGKVEVKIVTEQLDDPNRVASSFQVVLNQIKRHPTGIRSPMAAPGRV